MIEIGHPTTVRLLLDVAMAAAERQRAGLSLDAILPAVPTGDCPPILWERCVSELVSALWVEDSALDALSAHLCGDG